ncbi:MAG TPA: methylated-DNA--[protein]-cysteine S-methyltransferase [Acidimicrobiales bacterium]
MSTTHDLETRLRHAGVVPPTGSATTNGSAPDPGTDHVGRLVAAAVARADADDLVDVAWAAEDTPIGTLTLAATRDGLVRIGFGHDDDMLTELATRVSPRVVHLPARLDDLRRQLDEYFAGRRRHFEVPLDRRLSRGYRLAVLEELSQVPYGETVSYKDLAVRTGHPTASRAVGTAMATNPIPIVVPCHRVLRTGGQLGGYGGGLDTKVWLLRHEGALLG